MITHSLKQGSKEWHEFRARHFAASDAPAMMGVSPHKTRSELLREVHCRTGSLEGSQRGLRQDDAVHCRTGSLEVAHPNIQNKRIVHCRTGSLEVCPSII